MATLRSPTSIVGSDIHVMLALRRRSRQVVVTDEEFDSTDMIGELLGTLLSDSRVVACEDVLY